MKTIHLNLVGPFDVHLLKSGFKRNIIARQGLVQYWKKGSKVMEIHAITGMNKPMQNEYYRFLQLYLKHGRTFIEVLRSQYEEVVQCKQLLIKNVV